MKRYATIDALRGGQEPGAAGRDRIASGAVLLIRERTALMNEMRGLLAESGVVSAQGARLHTDGRASGGV